MRISIQSFIPTLAAAMALAVGGCGGGSTNTVVEPTGNPHLVSSSASLQNPKLMTVSNGQIFIANQVDFGRVGLSGFETTGILKIDAGDSLSAQGFSGLFDAIGINVDSSGYLYVSGKTTANASAAIYKSDGTRLAFTSGSHYGMAFDKNDNLIAPSINLVNKLALSTKAVGYPSWTALTMTHTPQAFARKGDFLYITTTENIIYKLDLNNINNPAIPLTLTGLPLQLPNGIAFEGDDMYVVNYGTVGGTASWVAKITNESVVTEFKKDPNWLCASAGIAVRGNYIYVGNGSTTSVGCGNIQNTIVKFFH